MRHDAYRPVSPRQKLLILLVAVLTAAGVLWMLLERPGAVFPPRPAVAASGPPVCADGRGTGCIGGLAGVIAAPPSTAASAARVD